MHTSVRSVPALSLALSLALALSSVSRSQARPAPKMELWYQQHSYLTTPRALAGVKDTMSKAAGTGYTGVLLWDTGLNVVNQPFWNANLEYLKSAIAFARAKGLEIMPVIFPYGHSNDILNQNPNWAEGQRVIGSRFRVSPDGSRLERIDGFPALENPGFELGRTGWFSYNDTGVGVDRTVAHTGSVSSKISTPPGNARLVQTVAVTPWRQYHLRFWVKGDAAGRSFDIYVSDGDSRRLNESVPVSRAGEWIPYDFTINSASSKSLTILMGIWGGARGTVWVDDIRFEETALVYVIRRAGAPLRAYDPDDPKVVYREGADFNYISDPSVSPGGFKDKYHEPPAVLLPRGTRLRPGNEVALDYYAVVPIYYGQVGMCLTDPDLARYLEANLSKIVELFGKGNPIMFGYDEMRHMNSCAACKARNLTAGQLLAWNVRQSMGMLQKASPASVPHFWGDMFDPNMNAHKAYYHVEGDIAQSWLGLPSNATIFNWNLDNLAKSLQWFAGLTPQQPTHFRQIIAGFYDPPNNNGAEAAASELKQAAGIPGVAGLMYTTWTDNYGQLAPFAEAAKQAWRDYVDSLAH